MKILSVIGTRPQLVKAAAVSGCLRQRHDEVLLDTGQHYDDEMSARFFRELGIPAPDYALGVGSGSHASQTSRMLVGIEAAIERERPDVMLVYGDTNSTLAGALAAAKLGLRIAHVEAGLRSFNRAMPEEINRVVTDHLATLLFCPGQRAADQLAAEGITAGVHVVGDVMADAFDRFGTTTGSDAIVARHDVRPGGYLLATVHRAENVDDQERLRAILAALDDLDETVIFPMHPRVRAAIDALGHVPRPHVRPLRPVGYLEMMALERHARAILTDSGGVQKEAYWSGTPCITLRDETEWVETVEQRWNTLVGADRERIVAAVRSVTAPAARPPLYERGAANAIVRHLAELS